MKYLLIFLLMLSAFGVAAQGNYDKEALRKLVLATLDMKQEQEHRDMLAGFSVVPDKREDFKNEYDAGIEAFVKALEEYYKSHYTPSEIKQLVVFYETPAGKKLAQDIQRLVSGEFPKGKEWDKQLFEMKKKDKEESKKQQ